MTVVKPYSTIKTLLSGVVILLSMLACGQYVPTVTPTAAPTQIPTATQTARPTASPSLSPTDDGSQAIVVKPIVQIHTKAGGDILSDKWLEAGDEVQIVACDGSWCEISKPVSGWVWRGCLSDNPDNLGCEAK